MGIRIAHVAVAVAAGVAAVGGIVAASGSPVHVPTAPNVGRAAVPHIVSTTGTSVFTSIAPCRILDTRISAAGPLQRGVVRAVQVSGSAGFATQGGKSTGCAIPSSATSIAYSISSVQAKGTGFLRLWPVGIGEQNATALNFGTAATTSGATVQINPGTAAGLLLIAHGAVSGAVIDVNGYYAPQIQAGVSSTGTLVNPTARVLSSVKTSTGQYTVTTDSALAACTPSVTTDGGAFTANAYNVGNQVFVRTAAASAGTVADANFHVSEIC